MFSKDITIEELIEKFPGAIPILNNYGVKCFICGEPTWGTVEESAKEKGMTDEKIDEVMKELNDAFSKK